MEYISEDNIWASVRGHGCNISYRVQVRTPRPSAPTSATTVNTHPRHFSANEARALSLVSRGTVRSPPSSLPDSDNPPERLWPPVWICAAELDDSRTELYQNCTKTPCNCYFGAYFERGADSPKLLKTLKTEGKGWSLWSARTRLQSRCSDTRARCQAGQLTVNKRSLEAPRFYSRSIRSNCGFFGRQFIAKIAQGSVSVCFERLCHWSS